jgi:hypothetical protein
MAPVRPVLHRLSCSNEMVQNAPKYEFWDQWIGLVAFVANKALVRLVLHRLLCSNETIRNTPKH